MASRNFATNPFGTIGPPARNTMVDQLQTRSNSTVSDHNDIWAHNVNARTTSSTRHNVLEDFIANYTALDKENTDLVKALDQAQHDNEQSTRRQNELELQVKDLQLQVNSLRNLMNCDTFLVVIIDGHDLIFNDDLLRTGKEGGKQAADILGRRILHWASNDIYDCPSNLKIVVRLFADVKGLAHACYRAGATKSSSDAMDFLSGFSQSKDLFDVTDVGGEVESINPKIHAFFRLHLYDYHCRQILLGYSRNKTHTNMLKCHLSSPEALRRVSLVQGPLYDKGFMELPYNKIPLFDIFRPSMINIVNSAQSDFGIKVRLDPTCSPFDPRSSKPNDTAQPLTCVPAQVNTKADDAVPKTMPSRKNHEPSVSLSAPAGAWSQVASKAAALPFTDLTRPPPSTKQATTQTVMQNKYGQRIDPVMDYDYDSVLRVKKTKYCNQHYIGKGCCHWQAGNGACPHNHDEVLNKEQLKWLRVVARETACKKGTHCTDADCIYGHHCPYPKKDDSTNCTNGRDCRFPLEMHNMDTKVVNHRVPR